MNQYYEQQPDLSSILQTLSAYAPPQPPQQQQPQFYLPQPSTQPPVPNYEREEGEVPDEDDYDPAASLAYQLPPPPPHPSQPRPSNLTASDPHAQSRSQRPTSSASSKPPPSTQHISSYPLALRHITTHLLPHPSFTPHIRPLIHEQHKHEREWHRDRVKLQQQLSARKESRRKLDAVLANFGAAGKPLGGNGDGGRGEMSEEQELRLFDRKVHKAQKEMVAAAEKELGRLGVPFFGREKWEGKEKELRDLRGKVLVLLNDLCAEDEPARE